MAYTFTAAHTPLLTPHVASTTLHRIPNRIGHRAVPTGTQAALASLLLARAYAKAVREYCAHTYGESGSWIAGGFRESWPEWAKERIRTAEWQATLMYGEAEEAWRAARGQKRTFRAVVAGLGIVGPWYVRLGQGGPR
jgi:hypothetical protein